MKIKIRHFTFNSLSTQDSTFSRTKKKRFVLIITGFFLLTFYGSQAQPFTLQQKNEQCKKIKDACLHAWNGYKKFAWGFDALRPISKTGQNWYNFSFLMTPVDAYDTFILLGMTDEAKEAGNLVLTKLNFNVNEDVQLFEVNIRLLGGLLSAYELSGNQGFLRLAVDLGKRLLPAFDSKTGMPYRYINLQTGSVRDPISNPAEIGTYLLEFGKLTQLTGDSSYYLAARKAAFAVYDRRSSIDLVGMIIDVNAGDWRNITTMVGARIDSYYEYLFKSWLLFGDKDCKAAWDTSNHAVINYLLRETPDGFYFTRANMYSGEALLPWYGALEAFYAGLLALSGDLNTARNVQQGNYHMWTLFNMEPEIFDFMQDTIVDAGYALRPENIESCFYLYRMTHDELYLWMGKRMIDDILDKCKTEAGYAAVKNVKTMELEDSMESFFFAETLKYAYLLFAPESTLDLNKYVFTTEAHPLRIQGK